MCFLLSWHQVLGSRPTIHASNFTASLITCNSLQLNWTYGDGSARLIVAREGSLPSFVPSDYTSYNANKDFGKGTDMGGGNFIVYNAGGTNFVRIDSLKTNKTYYFTIYEHDNAGSNTLYYTSNAPSTSATTHFIKMDFNIRFLDSCEEHNSFKFFNKSTSSIPGIVYTFYFGDASTATCLPGDSLIHSYKNKSGQLVIRLSGSPNLGCYADDYNPVRIYPKKNAYIDLTTFKDTMCLDGNYFEVDPKPLISPLPKYFTYNWDFGDGTTSTFKKMRKSYTDSGRYHVEVEIVTNVTSSETSCKDTLRFDLVVLPSPIGSINVNDTFQCITHNNFVFTNYDNTLTYYRWYYKNNGNKDSALTRSFSHKYAKTGKDTIIHVAYSSTGCKGRDTLEVEVLDDLVSDFNGLNSEYCSSKTPVQILPVVPGGSFEEFPLDANNAFIPSQVGKHQLRYIVTTAYCKDTTTKNFEIFPTPQPNLGNDVAVCNEGSLVLSANYTPGTYLWSTGETTPSITVSSTGTYWVEVMEGNCPGRDSANVVYSTLPIVELGMDTSVCKGNKMVLKVTNPRSTYLWQDGSTDSVYYVYEPGKYVVKVTNPCGEVTDSVYIFFQTDYCDLFMANAFSPDNDLINSVFMPVGKNITVELFQIYNRWGQLVFETDKDNVGWDGSYLGQPSPQDLYIWKLFYTTPSGKYVKKSNAAGTVLLIR